RALMGRRCLPPPKHGYARRIRKGGAVASIDPLAPFDHLADMAQLDQAEGGVELAHLGIAADAGDRDLVADAEIAQLVDPRLAGGRARNDRAAFERVESLRGVEAE